MSGYAFETYGELKEAIADWLMRKTLTQRIPQFVSMAEVRLDRKLRVKEMVQRRTAHATDQYVALPADWRAARNVQSLPSRLPLRYAPLDEIDRYRAALESGAMHPPSDGSRTYSIQGMSMELAPAPTEANPATIEMVYYANVPRLSGDEDSNWLLRHYPDLYLYGALIHSAPFLKDDTRLAMWETLFQQALDEANQSDAKGRYSGAPLRAGGAPSFGV